MKRWVAVAAVVVVAVAATLSLRRYDSTRSRTASESTHTTRTPSPTHPSLMPNPDSEPAGSLRLTGRVLGPDGKGLADADVWVDTVPGRTVTSGPDGAFEFDKMLSRSYEIRAKAGELIGGPLVTRLTARGTPVVLRLREGAHLLVTVVDGASAPIAKAELRVVAEESVSVTDEKGRAKVTAHPGWVALEASGAGYAPRVVGIPLGSFGSTARLTITLHKGFPVGGRVVDEERRPIANVRVYAVQASGMIAASEKLKEAAVTDERGNFTIPSAVGTQSFVAIDEEHAPATTPSFDVDRAIASIEIIMKRGAVYAGSVVDTAGKPVAGARVHCDSMGPLGQRRYSTTADANGTFEIRGLPRTIVMAHATSESGVTDQATMNLMEQPEQRDQKLVLNATDAADGVISGVVVDDTGAPVPDITVNAALQRGLPMTMQSGGVDATAATSTSTDLRGQFSIGDLIPGEYGLWPGAFAPQPLPSEAAQYGAAKLDRSWFMTTAKTGEKSVRLVMPRAAAIKGRLAFADTSEPVSEFTVSLQPSHDHDFGTSGERGAIELRSLRPGTFALRITGPSFLDVTKADVVVLPGKTTDIGTITVQRGRTLRGRVVDGAGRPVAGAKVMLGFAGVYGGLGKFDENYSNHKGAISDATGAFSIDGVQTKPLGATGLIVGADHPSYGRALPVSIPSGAQEPPAITLTLRDCGSIAGRVMSNGKPVAAALIGAGWPEIGMATATDDGLFAISRLPVGPVVLRVHGSGPELSRTHQQTVQVEAGKQTELMIDIPVGSIKLAVAVKPKAGHEVVGAKLFLMIGTVAFENYAQVTARMFADNQGFASWEGDPNQPAAFERVAPGDYTVCTMPLAWSPNDQTQMQRVHRGDREAVKVYCTPVRVLPSPSQQALTVEVPSMAPWP